MEKTQPGGATASQTTTPCGVRVKEEYGGDSTARHSHRLKVKYNTTAEEFYTISCHDPRTVLEAIKLSKKYDELKCSDENIVIQLGRGDKKYAVATHFPCSCISPDESLIITCQSGKVEETRDSKPIYSRDEYSVFYIRTVGGLHTKQKKLFRNQALKDFMYVCVYGEKGTTVEEALKRDSRFIDNLDDFILSDIDDPSERTEPEHDVDLLDNKTFKLCLPRNKGTKAKRANQQTNQCASNDPQHRSPSARSAASDVVQSSNTAHKVVPGRTGDVQHSDGSAATVGQQSSRSVMIKEINDRARRQFPKQTEWMEKHFPGDSYQRALDLRKEDFGKIQSSFSEVHTVRKLLELSESVCLLKIKCNSDEMKGTGFVLFDNLILTNAHLFKECSELPNWQKYTTITAQFNYENSDSESNWISFNVKGTVVSNINEELDYAILEFDVGAQNKNVPPGLLKNFGSLPLNGATCIVGHPAGGVKKMDPTCIIEKERREQAVTSNLVNYKDYLFTLYAINQEIKDDPRADTLVTYNTFMYHGSSGSPVFDAHGRVFGLHSGGFFFGNPIPNASVIEFAHPLLLIFKDMLSKLEESGKEEVLKRVKEEAKGNPHLENILEPEVALREGRQELLFRGAETVKSEPADTEESMDTD